MITVRVFFSPSDEAMERRKHRRVTGSVADDDDDDRGKEKETSCPSLA